VAADFSAWSGKATGNYATGRPDDSLFAGGTQSRINTALGPGNVLTANPVDPAKALTAPMPNTCLTARPYPIRSPLRR